jgi:predicted ATPase
MRTRHGASPSARRWGTRPRSHSFWRPCPGAGTGFWPQSAPAPWRRPPCQGPQRPAPWWAARALGELRGYLQLAVRGQRQLVWVTGEPGIGKTALVDASQRQAAMDVQGLRLARGQCIEGYGGKEAYYPMLDALGHWCRGGGGDAVVQTLAAHAPTWLVQFPALVTREHRELLQRELLGATRQRIVREICEALETLTAARPLLLMLEDLQWVDPATVDLLAALARRRGPAKLMLLATSRPMDGTRTDHPLQALTPELLAHQLCHAMALEPLSEADVAAYLTAESSGASLPEGLAGLVYRHSEGNPLFMVAALDHLTQRGLLAREHGRWHLRVPLEAIELGVPERLRQMLEAQIERLSPDEQRLLEGASVAGAVFATHVSAAAIDLTMDDVEDLCEKLGRRQ